MSKAKFFLVSFFVIVLLRSGWALPPQKGGGRQPNPTTFQFIHLGEDEGLSQKTITAILQDRQGFLWFGTEDGLVRYNGYRFHTFTHFVDDSLSLSNHKVTSLFEDSRGRLWVGTTNGLNYFDPQSESFVRIRTLPENYDHTTPNLIHTICEDRNGDLWTGNSIGLSRIQFIADPHDTTQKSVTRLPQLGYIRITHLSLQAGQSNKEQHMVLSMLIDSRGNFWVGTDMGVMRLVSLSPNSRSESDVDSYKFENLYRQSDDHSPLLNTYVLGFLEDRNGFVWVSTSLGLVRIGLPDTANTNGLHPQIQYYPSEGSRYRRGGFLEVRSKQGSKLWLSNRNHGFVIFDPQNGTYHALAEEAATASGTTIPYYITDIYRDRTGLIWLGTDSGGLYKYDPVSSRFSNFHPDLNQVAYNPNIDMRFVFEDSRGDLWIANEGVYRCNRQTGEILAVYWANHQQVHDWTFKNKIVEDGHGFIWLGSEFGGLYRYDPNSQRMSRMTGFSTNAEDFLRSVREEDIILPNNRNLKPVTTRIGSELSVSENVTALCRDPHGNIWVAANVDQFGAGKDGAEPALLVSHIDINTQKIRRYRLDRLISPDFQPDTQTIFAIHAEYPGVLWLGTSFGLVRFEPATGAVKVYRAGPRQEAKLSNNRVQAVTADWRFPERYLWVGTDGGGLCRFDKSEETFRRYTLKDGLPDEVVSSVLSDRQGNLWLGTSKGLCNASLSPDTREIVRLRNYDRSNGIIDDDFSFFYGQNAHQNAKGEMFFAGAQGISIFDPEDIRDNELPPPVVITGFYLNFKPANYRDPGSPLPAPLSQLEQLELSYQDNTFVIELAALDFQSPEKNRFAYRLEGYQDEWVYPGSERRAVFTQVPPGNYTFHAKAANSYGVWNESGVTLQIRIIPPWYRTWWAYLLYILIIGGFLYLVRRYEINRQQLQMQAEIKHHEAERLKEIDRIKTRFFTNISHEFRTPLALILGPVEQVLEESKSKIVRRRMKMAQRNIRRLKHLINQLLDLSRLEAEEMILRAAPDDIVAFVKQISMGFSSWAERKNITLNIYSVVEKAEIYFDHDLMEKVLNNLLSNAIKFTPQGGKIEVTVQMDKDNRYVEILISDNGIGIPPERLPFIFDRFTQVDESTTRDHEGSGIGLALVKELVELHQGSIKVVSTLGKGSVFTLSLPLGKEHLKPEQVIASFTASQRVAKIPESEYQYLTDTGPSETGENGDKAAKEGKVLSKALPLVLVVEDHADFRRYICDILKGDCRIIEAGDGQSGWDKAVAQIPDMIISDVMMPYMNGYELCHKLKNDQRTSHIPVILLTAKATQEEKLEGLDIGADAYLSKPFDSRELRTRVRQLIDQRRKLQAHYQQHATLKSGNDSVSAMDQQFLQKALEIVSTSLSNEQFSVDHLAAEMGMSRSQLHRKINALTGKPATHFIRAVRLERAAELLRSGNGNITEIAYEVGFGSQSYFTRCFTEHFGCSPSEFVQQKNT
jgi:signal transduction histidine kinase/ligand-binding sensor domain-containing protein/DNA-binding response OmpR family regulator